MGEDQAVVPGQFGWRARRADTIGDALEDPTTSGIDLDAVIEAYADVANGREMSEYLYTRYRNQDRNIAVMFMVDMSGSTKGWINDAERESLVLLCEALEILGLRPGLARCGAGWWFRPRCLAPAARPRRLLLRGVPETALMRRPL